MKATPIEAINATKLIDAAPYVEICLFGHRPVQTIRLHKAAEVIGVSAQRFAELVVWDAVKQVEAEDKAKRKAQRKAKANRRSRQ